MIAQLDTKTVYSFMESVVSIEKYLQMAKEYGYSHLAIMDVDNLYGAYHFLEATRKHSIQPLIGLEMTLVKDEENLSLRFLALSTKGYQELMKLSTLKMTGRKNWSDFTSHLEDVAIIVPYFEGIEQLDLGHDYFIGVSLDTPQEVFTRPILPLYQVNSFEKEDIQVLQILSAVKDNVSLREVDLHSQQGIFYLPQTWKHGLKIASLRRLPISKV
ncbi:PHP domain protein [Streptococcus oralis SK313]|uniref:PHP domain protein n=1 Tax=Streptococcus oralis SK313 TaxID=1035190 RepID=F9Q1Q0_STROR|nr:PHP domain protein [Streptococcus oralis SK313]